jgi:O-methyltransferase
MIDFLIKQIKELGKTLVFRYTPIGRPKYEYNLEPIQLAEIINQIERLKNSNGNILEVGVARGMTTKFVLTHLRLNGGLSSGKYIALDTFKSFPDDDLSYEVNKRGKKLWQLKGFSYISLKSWTRNFRGVNALQIEESDCKVFDYKKISPIKFALIDVDLYLPTLAALEGIFNELIPGGAILIDDCKDDVLYDGAYSALKRFLANNKLDYRKIGTKGALIIKSKADGYE